jgi:nucleoside-diphosphate-sugar epimerase
VTAELIAVTGATGAIGRRLVTRLSSNGISVVGLSRHPPNNEAANIVWRPFSLSDPAEITSHKLRDVDQVIHLAAYVPGSVQSEQGDVGYWTDNVLGTQRLVHAMSLAGTSRLVLAGAANVYAPAQLEADENSPVGPRSRVLYLASKAAQEWVAASMCQNSGIDWAAMRISSIIADGRSIVDRLAFELAADKQITIDDGAAFGADFVDCDDVCEGLMLAVQTKLCGICNLSSGERTELLDVVLALAQNLGKSPDSIKMAHVDHAPDTGFPAINCDRLKSYGYRPTPLSQVLDRIAANAAARAVAI